MAECVDLRNGTMFMWLETWSNFVVKQKIWHPRDFHTTPCHLRAVHDMIKKRAHPNPQYYPDIYIQFTILQ